MERTHDSIRSSYRFAGLCFNFGKGLDDMNREALFCDGTQDYVIPAEPEANEKVVLRFRTAHNDVEDGEYIYIGAPSAKIRDWDQVPASMDIRNFYGGDLQGVMDKLSTAAGSLITGRTITRSLLFPASLHRHGRKGP